MKKGEASQTAEAAAAVRAIHRLQGKPVVFDDSFAHQLTSPMWRRVATNGFLRWLVGNVILKSQGPIAAQVVGRSRFAEDLLEQAIEAGISQYVVIGAGFDSFALRYRDRYSALNIFELDHPDTQSVKRERILGLGAQLPSTLEFVAVNFEDQTVADALAASNYQAALPGFFSWLGTTPYLSNEATLDTLRSIATYAAPGSELVFDYLAPDEILSESERRIMQKLRRFTEKRSEPLIGSFHPEQIGELLDSVGLELVDNCSGKQQAERYFAGRDDELSPIHASYFVHVRVRSISATGGAP